MHPEGIQLLAQPNVQHAKSIHFPDGLPAFENMKDFVLLVREDEAPFMWLQALNAPDLAFVVVDPFILYPHYLPDILEEDCQALQIERPEDAFLLAIVNIRHVESQGVTANLVGPLVIDWKQQIGKQTILRNHLRYSVKHRIDAEES